MRHLSDKMIKDDYFIIFRKIYIKLIKLSCVKKKSVVRKNGRGIIDSHATAYYKHHKNIYEGRLEST